jgi:hypothetical protein
VSETVEIGGAGQMLTNVHDRADCTGGACPIHSPSDHRMRDWPLNWRDDRRLMERICPHGIGHPDPDHLAHTERLRGKEAADTEGVHGCDGCCRGKGPS